jgi:hypothetical protein
MALTCAASQSLSATQSVSLCGRDVLATQSSGQPRLVRLVPLVQAVNPRPARAYESEHQVVQTTAGTLPDPP